MPMPVSFLPGGWSERILWRGSFWRLTIFIVKREGPSKSSADTEPLRNKGTLVDEAGQRRPTTYPPTVHAQLPGSTFQWALESSKPRNISGEGSSF